MSIDEQFLLCFPKPVKLHSLFWNTPLTICWMPMKSNHCCLVTTTNRLRSAFFCQSFTFPSGQMCLPAKADSSNPMSQPPTISFSLSLFLFPLPIVLSFLLHLSALAHTRWCYPPKKCSGVWREAAPGSITRHEWGHRLLPQLHMNIFRLTVACSKLESVFLMYRSRLSCNQLSQDLPRGAFSSQHVFPLAGYYFKQGSQYRKELDLIGMPPPTVHVFSSL